MNTIMSSLFGTVLSIITLPGVVASIALSSLGIVWRRPLFLVAAGVLYAPFSWYLSLTPKYGSYALYLPLLLVPAAVAVHYGRAPAAWLLLALLTILSWGRLFVG